MESSHLLDLSRTQYMPLIGHFDACLLVLTEEDLKRGNKFLEWSGPLLKQDGHIFVFTMNQRTNDFEGFGSSIAYNAAQFSNLKMWLSETKFVRASKLRWYLRQTIVRLSRAVARRPLFYLPVAAIAGGFLALAAYLCNRAALHVRSQPSRRGYSSVFMAICPSPSIPLPRFEGEEPALSHLVMNNAEHEPPDVTHQTEPTMNVG
jgi:hypothetical protein